MCGYEPHKAAALTEFGRFVLLIRLLEQVQWHILALVGPAVPSRLCSSTQTLTERARTFHPHIRASTPSIHPSIGTQSVVTLKTEINAQLRVPPSVDARTHARTLTERGTHAHTHARTHARPAYAPTPNNKTIERSFVRSFDFVMKIW